MEEEKHDVKPKKSKQVISILIPVIVKFVSVALVFWIGLTFVFSVYRYEGNNMYPALKDGDLCIMYKLEDYYTGDVIFFYIDGEIKSGRIVAKPSDIVDADETGILINGSHIPEEIFYETDMNISENLPIELNNGQFYVLNDYRIDINDSRIYGIVDENDIQGKLIFLFRRRCF